MFDNECSNRRAARALLPIATGRIPAFGIVNATSLQVLSFLYYAIYETMRTAAVAVKLSYRRYKCPSVTPPLVRIAQDL
jgi:hypothetical protein